MVQVNYKYRLLLLAFNQYYISTIQYHISSSCKLDIGRITTQYLLFVRVPPAGVNIL